MRTKDRNGQHYCLPRAKGALCYVQCERHGKNPLLPLDFQHPYSNRTSAGGKGPQARLCLAFSRSPVRSISVTTSVAIAGFPQTEESRPGFEECLGIAVTVRVGLVNRGRHIREWAGFTDKVFAEPVSGAMVAGLRILDRTPADTAPIVQRANRHQGLQVVALFRSGRPARSAEVPQCESTAIISSTCSHLGQPFLSPIRRGTYPILTSLPDSPNGSCFSERCHH